MRAPATRGGAAAGERRQLTVLFCDLVGSMSLSELLDAEEWRDLIDVYHRTAAIAVTRFGGHVAQYLGDGVLVYFGWPTAHEDDPERGVRAGLAILDAMLALNDTLVARDGMRLAVRVGLHTGTVVIGEMGGGTDVLALGDTTNIAARVQGAAEPDTVVVTAATQRLVAGMFVVEDRGPQALKGVRDAVTLYRVVQPSGVRSRLDVAGGRLTRFVGRDMELGTLIDRWERAQEGEAQTVLVHGEAGVGKSRLVYQLHEHLADVPHTWLECGATPYTEGTPFHPIVSLVTQGLAFAATDSEAEKLAKVERGLGALASEESTALLADFLGLHTSTRLQISPELQRRRTIDLLVQWTLSLSEAQPLVLLVEDLHWSDASTLELLGHLIARGATARVLRVVTARPDFASPWPARSNVTDVQLSRLTKHEARDMVATVTGTELPADTLDALVERADGVPLYVEELAKAMAELGVGRGVEAIPASLADSLMARLDRLAAAKEIAQRAAVLGREFGYPLLAAMVGTDDVALRDGLTRLIAAEILFARGEPPESTYTFKHALIQETAYQSLLKRTRQQLHARVAEALETRFPERARTEPELIARHYDQAGLLEQASTHYRRAGERATERSANEEAIGHLRRALELVGDLPESRERHQTELGLQMALGAPLSAARGWSHPERDQTYARARELAHRIGESPELPRVLVEMAGSHLVKGDLLTGGEVAAEALTAAERTGEAFALLAAHYQVGQSLIYQGRFSAALRHFEETVRLYDPNEHASLAYTVGLDYGVSAHGQAAYCNVYLGYLDTALTLSEQGVLLSRRVEHPLSHALAVFFVGLVSVERGDIDRTRARVEEVVDLAEQLGLPFYVGLGRVIRGWARVECGEGEAGILEMQQGMGELSAIGSGLGAPGILVLLAESLRKVGRLDDAVGALGLGVALADAQGQHYANAELHRLQAAILLDTDCSAVARAEALFRSAIEIARGQEAKTFELRATTDLARLLQRQGKVKVARDLLAPLYAWFTQGFDTRDVRGAKALLDALR